MVHIREIKKDVQVLFDSKEDYTTDFVEKNVHLISDFPTK
jgi:hypothetical protein